MSQAVKGGTLAPPAFLRRRAALGPAIVLSLTIVLSILLVLAEAWHEWNGRRTRIAEIQTMSTSLAHSVMQDVERNLSLADVALVGIVQQLEANGTRPGALTQVSQLLDRQLDNQPEVRNFSVYDADGRLLLSSFATQQRGVNIADRQYFRQHQDETQPAARLGTAVRSRLNGQWVLTISRRHNDRSGRFNGVVVAALDISRLTRILSRLDLGRHGSVSLVNASGRLLARAPADESALGALVLDRSPLQGPVGQRQSGSFQTTSAIDGVDRLGAFQSSEYFPFAVVVGWGSEEALAAWVGPAKWRIMVVMGMVCFTLLLGTHLFRHARRRQDAERTLLESEARFRLLAEHARDMVSHLDSQGVIRYASPAATRLLGQPLQDVVGQSFENLFEAEDRPAIRAALMAAQRPSSRADVTGRRVMRSGSVSWIETTIQGVKGGNTGDGFVAISRDVTERKVVEVRMAELATTDGLTGLANRRRFDEVLALEWQRAAREGQSLAVILLDVDRFKLFNDTYGHLLGDDVLVRVAQAISAAVRRPSDVPARYGGEEFAVILPNTVGAGALDVAERVQRFIRDLGIVHDANEGGIVTVSIGVAAVYLASGSIPDTAMLLKAADAALYEAKRTGRNRVVSAPDLAVFQGRAAA
ncbi:diguanylate cyclase [Muricoccus radiodurans]|uniref:diguanylate cyclase n=1 Tax=Muricoccus radiodurans TaxID=2231721 RepID=UPI003CF17DE4